MPQNSPPKFKRKIIVIKRLMQTKYVFLVFASVFVASIIMCWDVFNTFKDIRVALGEEVYPLLHHVQGVMIVKLLLFMVVVVFVAIFASHRFAGPIFRFERSCESVAKGDLTHRVSLRESDELGELKDQFNAMIESLQGKVSKDQSMSKRLLKRLDEIAASPKSDPEVSRALRELKAEVDFLTREFKV